MGVRKRLIRRGGRGIGGQGPGQLGRHFDLAWLLIEFDQQADPVADL
jgi:hypothetical protein